MIAVSLVIRNNKGQILLGERFEEFGRGMMGSPGGEVRGEESFLEAAEREVLEETGLKRSEIIFGTCFSTVFENVMGTDGLTVGVLAQANKEPREISKDEIGNWQWFDLDQLPKNVFPPTKRAIQNYKLLLSRQD